MAVNYNRLFHKLIDMGISNSQLADDAQISPNIITRLKRNEYVSLETIEKICRALKCEPNDILVFQDKGDATNV